ncbi:MAG: hypothetical protein ACXVFM_05880, partial [Solirubrobacteraceae bacterium]
MSAIRGVLRDLVERKLWPIAVLLLAAAVAVPMYLGRASADEAPLPATSLQADAGKVSKAAVKVDDGATGGDDRPGGVRNPFKQLHVPKKPAVPAAATPKTPAADQPAGSGSGGSDGSQPPLAP